MNRTRLTAFAFAVFVAVLPVTLASAQAPAKSAANPPEQPGLAALLEPNVAKLRAAGVRQITARTGKQRRDIQVLSQYAPVYFGWPKNVAPVEFEIYLNPDGQTAAYANDFNDATKPKFSAALDAIVPQALRGATNAKATAQRPKP